MSDLRERIEGLVAKWRRHEIDSPSGGVIHVGELRALGMNWCADELAAALAAEGQGDTPSKASVLEAIATDNQGITLNLDFATAGEIGLFEFLRSKGFRAEQAAAPSLHKEGAGGATDSEIFQLACKLVDTASSDRKTYWLPVLSQLCEAVRREALEEAARQCEWMRDNGCEGERGCHTSDADAIRALAASPAGRAEQVLGSTGAAKDDDAQ
jgi:hypothetical protein